MAAPDVPPPEGPVPSSDIPDEEAVREQLERILASSDFSGAARGSAFLRFLVEETLAGRQDRLKEYTLAIEVFERDESFDTGTNPAVRVEAGRLRKRLEHYYLTQGREDPLLIELPRGSYVPRFRSNPDILHLQEVLDETRTSVGDAVALASIPTGPSIAVLPFTCLNGEHSRVFSDGITVEIITALSRFREFRVLGRHTTFNRHNGEEPLEAARALGTRYVLSGSVRRTDDKVRVNAELSSARDGSVLWSESYERDLNVEMLFDIQDDIANHVVVTIAQPYGVIVRPELVLARRKPTRSLDSYECVLLYYSYNADMSEEGHARALEALEGAYERDPDSPMVLAALAHLYVDSFSFGYNLTTDRHTMLERGLQYAQRAVQLDPLDPLNYRALFVARYASGDLKGFREAADRAVTLNPNNTDILADYGLHLVMSNDWERGRLFLKVALSLNPEPPDWYWMPFVSWHFWNGDYEAALDYALKIQGTGFYWTYCLQAMAFVGVGAIDEARERIARLLKIKPDFARNARDELARWVDEERIEPALEVLHQAGLEVPEST